MNTISYYFSQFIKYISGYNILYVFPELENIKTTKFTIVVSCLLFIGVLDLPYFYYSYLRVIVFLYSFYICETETKSKTILFLSMLGVILFNPFKPIEFSKDIWVIIDILFGIYLIIYEFYLKKSYTIKYLNKGYSTQSFVVLIFGVFVIFSLFVIVRYFFYDFFGVFSIDEESGRLVSAESEYKMIGVSFIAICVLIVLNNIIFWIGKLISEKTINQVDYSLSKEIPNNSKALFLLILFSITSISNISFFEKETRNISKRVKKEKKYYRYYDNSDKMGEVDEEENIEKDNRSYYNNSDEEDDNE